jgi:hypothetical protein
MADWMLFVLSVDPSATAPNSVMGNFLPEGCDAGAEVLSAAAAFMTMIRIDNSANKISARIMLHLFRSVLPNLQERL